MHQHIFKLGRTAQLSRRPTRRIPLRIAPVLALAVVTGLANPVYPQSQEPSQPLRTIVQSFQTAWNAHDAGAVVAFYTDDADQVMNDGPTTVGRQALQQWWRSRFASMEPGRKIALTIAAVRLITPEAAIINVIATSGGHNAQGQALPASADRGTWVVVKKSGRWLMAALRVGPAEHAPAR